MLFMNEMEIDDAAERWNGHPILGPATRTLSQLRDETNRMSDGWHSWPKPCRAARKLQELIRRADHRRITADEDIDITLDDLKKAYSPIKAFCTRTPGFASAARIVVAA